MPFSAIIRAAGVIEDAKKHAAESTRYPGGEPYEDFTQQNFPLGNSAVGPSMQT